MKLINSVPLNRLSCVALNRLGTMADLAIIVRSS